MHQDVLIYLVLLKLKPAFELTRRDSLMPHLAALRNLKLNFIQSNRHVCFPRAGAPYFDGFLRCVNTRAPAVKSKRFLLLLFLNSMQYTLIV
jgi:hypothetical protein